ncbi:MAG: site-2 protease family protein [Bacilli bacterium]|nr:site-2 protease family protein [Bacilli bacterium]
MFGLNFDKRILYIIIGAVLLFSLVNMGGDGLMGLLLTLPGVIIAITFHEFAHAYSAYKLGDDTPLYQGRLNLNPLSHVDPIGLIMLIVAHFGWGKPVQINPNNFRGKYSLSASEAIVSVAGPVMNFFVALVFAFIYVLIVKFAGLQFMFTDMGGIVVSIVQYTIIVNVGLGVFNLIPLPPLDGSKVLMHFLPYNAKVWFESKETIFYIAFLILFITGIAGDIISPLINTIYMAIMNLVGVLF